MLHTADDAHALLFIYLLTHPTFTRSVSRRRDVMLIPFALFTV